MNCLTEEQWTSFFSNEREVDEEALRAHAEGCSSCRQTLEQQRLVFDVVAAPVAFDEARFLSRLEARASVRRPPATVVAGLAAAALIVIGLGWQWRSSAGEFEARGGAAGQWHTRVSAELRRVDAPTVALTEGQPLAANDKLSVWYRNLEFGRPLFVLAYLVDARGELHWVTPGYRTVGVEPQPAMLLASNREALWPESIQLEDPAPGAGMVVVIISEAPGSVLQLEAAPRGLRADPSEQFPGAVIWRRRVVISP